VRLPRYDDLFASRDRDLKDEAENEKYLAEAIKIYEDTNDPLGKVKILARIISRFRSDTPQYAKYLEKILRATEEVRKPADKAAALKEVASVYIGGAEFRKGLDYYEKAIKAYADAGLRKEQAGLLVEAGVQSGGYSRSTQDKRLTPGFYQRALTIYRELGDRESEDDVLSRLGSHYDTNDQLPEAIDSFKQQAALPGIGPKREADLHSKIAWLQKRLERWEESIVSNRRALVIYESMANRSSQSDTLVSIGEGHVRLNQLGQSLEAFKQAGALQPGRNYKALQANHIFNRGEAEEKKQQLSKALESYKQALVLFKEIDKYEERVKDAETKIEKVSKSLQPPQP
jgi:tetratricopeptide (TPR) repeat protein